MRIVLIGTILRKRQLSACEDWKAFGEELSGCEVIPFDINQYQKEYGDASQANRDDTSFGRFIIAAMRQKSMVTNAIFESGNMIAGFSVDYLKKGFKGMKDFKIMAKNVRNE